MGLKVSTAFRPSLLKFPEEPTETIKNWQYFEHSDRPRGFTLTYAPDIGFRQGGLGRKAVYMSIPH